MASYKLGFSLFLMIISFSKETASLPSSAAKYKTGVIMLDDMLHSTPEDLKDEADIVVSKDGTTKYRTIKEAVDAAPDNSKKRFIIYVKKGIYNEIITIGEAKKNLTLIGDGSDATILTASLNAHDGVKTYNSATLAVEGEGFMAQYICIQNTAGPAKGQAVALRVSADRSVIYRCRIEAYQDTLYAYQFRQFYRECHITGTVDFIFGKALAVFQYCQIEVRKPLQGQSSMITAQSRPSQSMASGFTIQKCNITASSDLAPVKGTVKTYLGRPWGVFSTVVIMQSFIDDLVDPAGWAPWNSSDIERQWTVHYMEYQNRGPGSATSKRVKWKGFKVIRDRNEAANFTVGKLLNRDLWLNWTGVPFEEGI